MRFVKNFVVKRAMRRGKVLGFYHVEQGNALSGEALAELARSESFAFTHASRFFSRWASAIRSAYEEAFIETYNAMVVRYHALHNAH